MIEGWMEVFRAGRHVASNGAEKEWTVEDLRQMAESYDPGKHEAPITIGHPKANAPAWGWIKALKVDGDRLLALPGEVAAEFADLVRAGRYKKRSISVYPDGTLRHVGFLGAQPPAVKGLKDIEFAAEAADTYEYSTAEETGMDELEKMKQQLEEERRKREFAEAEAATAKQERESARSEFAELQAETRKAAVTNFVEQGIKDGKILPAWKQQGLAEFMTAIDGGTETYEFSEGKKQTPLEWFQGFIQSFGEHPLFKVMAKPETDKSAGDDFSEDVKTGEQIAAKVNPPKA